MNDDQVFISIDVEASGSVPGMFNLVSVGATAVRKTDGRWTLDPDDLYFELKPVFDGFDPEAMAIHGISREHLEATGLETREAMEKLRSWSLERAGGPDSRPVFVGHNALFDWAYINHYFKHTGVVNPYGYDGLDTKALSMGTLGIPWRQANKSVLQKRLPIPKHEDDKAHRADYDARYQAEILRALLEILDQREQAAEK